MESFAIFIGIFIITALLVFAVWFWTSRGQRSVKLAANIRRGGNVFGDPYTDESSVAVKTKHMDAYDGVIGEPEPIQDTTAPSISEAEGIVSTESSNALTEAVREQKPRSETNRMDEKHRNAAATDELSKPIIGIHLWSRQPQGMHGKALLEVFAKLHLTFGKYDIFHRDAHRDGRLCTLYSVHNAVEPGTLEIERLENATFHTPALVFFFQPHDPWIAYDAYDTMLKAARHCAQELDAEVCDMDDYLLTAQEIEFQRQQLRESHRQVVIHKTRDTAIREHEAF